MQTITQIAAAKTQKTKQTIKLPIPHLSVVRQITEYQNPERFVSEEYNTIERQYDGSNIDNELCYDVDGGEMLNWNYSYEDTAVHSSAVDDDEPYFDPAEIKHYCSAMDGARVSNAEPLEAMGGNYVYIDWMDCLKYWRRNLPKELIDSLDWTQLSPASFVVCADGTVKLA